MSIFASVSLAIAHLLEQVHLRPLPPVCPPPAIVRPALCPLPRDHARLHRRVWLPQSPTPAAVNNGKGSGAAATRRSAISQYSALFSTRIKRRPSSVQATPVVPEPANWSNT